MRLSASYFTYVFAWYLVITQSKIECYYIEHYSISYKSFFLYLFS